MRGRRRNDNRRGHGFRGMRRNSADTSVSDASYGESHSMEEGFDFETVEEEMPSAGLLPTPEGLLPTPGDTRVKEGLLPIPRGPGPNTAFSASESLLLLPPNRGMSNNAHLPFLGENDENNMNQNDGDKILPGPPSLSSNANSGPMALKPFRAIGLTPRGQKMLAQSENKDVSFENEQPSPKPKKVWYRGPIRKKNKDEENFEQSTEVCVPDFVKPNLVTEVSEENKKLPKFLLCPLCRDLLLDPLVLPCYHTICGTRCLPKLSQDGFHVWCPQCKILQKTKFGIESLQTAETFSKMSNQIREKKKEEIEHGEISEEFGSDMVKQFDDSSDLDELTCQICQKIFGLPLRLPCSHCICKFPCAYKKLMYNFKLVCPVCEKPTYLNGGMDSLPVAEELVHRIKAIKGENYLEDCERQWRELDEENVNTNEDAVLSTIDDRKNKMRLKNLEKKEAIPSLLSLDLPPPPSIPRLPPPSVASSMSDSFDPGNDGQPFEQNREEIKPLPIIPEEELLYSEEPIAAEIMGISWAGPKRCRQPVVNSNPKRNRGGKQDLQQRRQGNRRFGRNSASTNEPTVRFEGGILIKEHNHRPSIPSLMDDLPLHPEHPHGSFPRRYPGPAGLVPPGEEFGQFAPEFHSERHELLPPGVGNPFVPDGFDTGMYESAEIPGQEMVMNTPETFIAPMLTNTGSGPPPIVNYQSPAPISEPIPDTAPSNLMPMVPALPPESQPVPSSLPVMDPSTIPTMNSAFEYQAHWTKFVQQTMAYYNSIYAAQGGTPAEAQQMINDYLSKCWAWYSAFTNLCQVNPEYKEVKSEKNQEIKFDSGDQGQKQEGTGKKKKKKNKNKAMKQIATNSSAPDVNDMEPKEIEELKIMLLKKQLELKVKHARNKSELRELLNMKKLVIEEEGEEKVEEISEEEREKVKEAAKQKQLEREKEIERQEKEREKDRDKEILRLQEEREREKQREYEREKDRDLRERERQRRRDRRHDRDRDRYDRDDDYRRDRRHRRDRRDDRSYRRRGRSRSRSSSSEEEPNKKDKDKMKEESKDEEPKYIKIANLPDEVKAIDLKGFVENFGRVLNCKIGKMQGEMIAVVQMGSLADAMSCVRDMHGSQFKSKILEVKYMGTKPHLKQVEVSIPDVYSGPTSKPGEPYTPKPIAGPSFGYDGPSYYSKPPEIRNIWIGNLPWGTTEDEVMRFVSHHGRPFDCRIGTNSDPNQRGLFAIVTLETYIDVLKCINSLHGIRYEGRVLDVKKMKY